MVGTAYVGYLLIISLTAVPQVVFTIFAEATHAMDPNKPIQHHAVTPALMMMNEKPLILGANYSEMTFSVEKEANSMV